MSFLNAMTKYLTRNFRKVGRFSSQLEGTDHHDTEVTMAETWGSWSYSTHNQEREPVLGSLFYFFILSRTLIHEILLSTFRVYILLN